MAAKGGRIDFMFLDPLTRSLDPLLSELFGVNMTWAFWLNSTAIVINIAGFNQHSWGTSQHIKSHARPYRRCRRTVTRTLLFHKSQKLNVPMTSWSDFMYHSVKALRWVTSDWMTPWRDVTRRRCCRLAVVTLSEGNPSGGWASVASAPSCQQIKTM